MKKAKTYRKYSREFKIEALRLVDAGDKTATQVARELGIRVNQLPRWRLQVEAEKLNGGPVKRGRPADDELAQLKRENARLKDENDILKKAAIYFAREQA
jgi:transposase